MATIHEIPAERRVDMGKGASRRLRHAGKVPAIVYGGHQDPVSIQLEQLKAQQWVLNEWFYSNILDLQIDGKSEKVLLRDIQRHPFKPLLIHIDFQRVSATEKLRVRVPLHFLNQEKSPAGKTSGVVISHGMTDVEVLCLPANLPEFIEIDLGNLAIGDIIHMSDIKLPEGVEIPELKLGKEHDHAVVTAQHARGETGDTAEATPAA
jgi:large subunit ribosomal protein L25